MERRDVKSNEPSSSCRTAWQVSDGSGSITTTGEWHGTYLDETNKYDAGGLKQGVTAVESGDVDADVQP